MKIQRTKAKTAYGVLSDVSRRTKAEPLRMAMPEWIHRRSSSHDWDTPLRGYPKCGTVGCIGGWVEVLAGTVGEYDPETDKTSAEQVLGLTSEQGMELFYDNDLCADPAPQTRAHANKVIRHIRKFQRKYKAQLLAKKVEAL